MTAHFPLTLVINDLLQLPDDVTMHNKLFVSQVCQAREEY